VTHVVLIWICFAKAQRAGLFHPWRPVSLGSSALQLENDLRQDYKHCVFGVWKDVSVTLLFRVKWRTKDGITWNSSVWITSGSD